jgi:hypothetical protein
MFSNDPTWAAGYTTKDDYSTGREKFAGTVYAFKTPRPSAKIEYVKSVHGAEGRLLQLAGGNPKSLHEAGVTVHQRTGLEWILVRDARGHVTGGISLVPVAVSERMDPESLIREAQKRGLMIPSNLGAIVK